MGTKKTSAKTNPDMTDDEKAADAAVASNTVQDDMEFETIGLVTLPQLKLTEGVAIFICHDGPMETRPKKTKTGAQALDDEGNPLAITTCKVVDLRTGELAQVVVGKAWEQNVKEAYPNNGYVGRCFRVVKSGVSGKRWKAYDIREIKDPRTK